MNSDCRQHSNPEHTCLKFLTLRTTSMEKNVNFVGSSKFINQEI